MIRLLKFVDKIVNSYLFRLHQKPVVIDKTQPTVPHRPDVHEREPEAPPAHAVQLAFVLAFPVVPCRDETRA